MTKRLILTRPEGWERRLVAAIEHHSEVPGEWGRSDCWMMALDGIEAVTGVRLFPALRRYKSEAGGYRAFAKLGFTTVEEAFASALEPIGRFSAMRGDVGVVEREGLISAGVFDGEGLAVKTLYGDAKHIVRSDVQRFPLSAVKSAFKVGRA